MAWYMRAQQDSMPLRIRRIVRGDSHESVDCIDSPVRPLPGCGGRVDGKEERWGLPACLAQRYHLRTACAHVCDLSCFGAKIRAVATSKIANYRAQLEKRATVCHAHCCHGQLIPRICAPGPYCRISTTRLFCRSAQ